MKLARSQQNGIRDSRAPFIRVVLVFLLFFCSCSACQVPVFRYALERWRADRYTLKVSYHQLSEKLEQRLVELAAASSGASAKINIELDLEQLDSPQATSYELFAPPAMGQEAPLAAGEASLSSLAKVIDSPVRQKIVKQLLSGDSAVWVMLRSGDELKDQKVRAVLKQGIQQALAQIELPEGVIEKKDAETQKKADDDNKLKSDIPLKIAFSIVEFDRSDLEEQAFLKMFTAGQPASSYQGKVVIAPVFGRGRSTGPTAGNELTPLRVVQACKYICGPCSCGVKDENPGFDLLLAVDWMAQLKNVAVVKEKPIADLSSFASEVAVEKDIDDTELSPLIVEAPEFEGSGSISRYLLGGGVLFVLLILTGGYLVFKRGSANE